MVVLELHHSLPIYPSDELRFKPLWKAIVGEFNLLIEYLDLLIFVLGDDSNAFVRSKQHFVQKVYGPDGSESALPGFQYDVLRMPVLYEFRLRVIRNERDLLSVLILNEIEFSRKKPPFLIGKKAFEGFYFSHCISDRTLPIERFPECSVSLLSFQSRFLSAKIVQVLPCFFKSNS